MNDRCPDQVLFIARSLFISIAWTMVHSCPSLSLSFTPSFHFLPAILVYYFFLFLFATPLHLLLESSPRAEIQPLDKTSDLYEDYVDLRISIAFEGDDRF